MPSIQDLVPIYQDMVSFLSVQADGYGLISLSKELNISSFPSIVFFRGGVEVDRISKQKQGVVEALVRKLAIHLTAEDTIAHAKRRHRERIEKALARGEAPPVEEQEEVERGQLDWTWDPDHMGETMRIEADGMLAIMREEEDDDNAASWEYCSSETGTNWKPFLKETMDQIEKAYRSGDLYKRMYLDTTEVEIEVHEVQIGSYELKGFNGYLYKTGRHYYVRRKGNRLPVPN